MDLKQYEQTKFAMAEIVRVAQAVDTKDEDLHDAAHDLLMRLADDRFNLMLVGRFSRGKSTLINAIFGAAHLPTGILPLTSVITTVRYGSRTRAVLNFNGSRLSREIPLARLAEYVTQQSNPGNSKNIAYVEIELPVELLRRGVFFVDSPGLGSASALGGGKPGAAQDSADGKGAVHRREQTGHGWRGGTRAGAGLRPGPVGAILV